MLVCPKQQMYYEEVHVCPRSLLCSYLLQWHKYIRKNNQSIVIAFSLMVAITFEICSKLRDLYIT